MYRMKSKQYTTTKYSRYDAPGYEAETDSSEDENEFDSDSEPSVRPTMKMSLNERRYRDHRSLRPSLGVAARNRNRGRTQPIDTYSSTTYSSNVSSPLETTNETDPSDLYTPIPYRSRMSPPRRTIMMEEEISPVQPDSFAVPSLPFLKRHGFNPTITSTTTSMHKMFAAPKTNPHYGGGGMVCSTPRSSTSARRALHPLTTSYEQVLNMDKRQQRPQSCYVEGSSAWDNVRASSLRSIPETINAGYYRPENFGLHAAFAKNKNTKGIMFLTMTLCGSVLSVTVHRSVYFLDPGQPQICSFVQMELRKKARKEGEDQRKRHHRGEERRDAERHSSLSRRGERNASQSYRTNLIPSTNKPEFGTTFVFDLESRRESLFICVWAMSAEHAGFNINKKKMLGCMSFPISRLLDKAKTKGGRFEDENMSMDEIVLNDGGFFLLDDKDGQRNNMPQQKINKAEYYDDPALSGSCGMTTASFSSSNLTNSVQMPMEEFAKASRAFGSSLVPGYSSVDDMRPLDYSSASSSAASRDASSSYAYHGQHRATLPCLLTAPSITTTSDTTASDTDVFNGTNGSASQQPDYHFLYADAPVVGHRKGLRESVRASPSPKKDMAVRRAASFTYSPKASVDKHNKRPAQMKEDEKERRKLFGPISKTISYIRSKMDTALSTSSLYPSKDEIRQWETCFEALLNHKFGCALFRQFLKKEFSDENVDFWLECEEFKRMKDGKKATSQRAHEIYKEFVAEQSPKEVNLDSDTRAATKAALESGCKTDTFSLAQSRIEQLMEKDSYRRFLKDPLYQELLKSTKENGTTVTSS